MDTRYDDDEPLSTKPVNKFIDAILIDIQYAHWDTQNLKVSSFEENSLQYLPDLIQ